MSYDVDLTDPITGTVLTVESKHHIRGGTYAIGGDDRLSLNITWNYGSHFLRVFKEAQTAPEVWGIHVITGKTGAESIPILKAAIAQLGDDAVSDYWDATEGNAKAALYGLLAFAQMRPDGVWKVD